MLADPVQYHVIVLIKQQGRTQYHVDSIDPELHFVDPMRQCSIGRAGRVLLHKIVDLFSNRCLKLWLWYRFRKAQKRLDKRSWIFTRQYVNERCSAGQNIWSSLPSKPGSPLFNLTAKRPSEICRTTESWHSEYRAMSFDTSTWHARSHSSKAWA